MYCHCCGIHNTDDRNQCQMCEADLALAQKTQHSTIYADLTHFPYFPLLMHSLKNANPVLWLLMIPIITLLYGIKKMTKAPFLSPLMNCKTPELHITRIDHIQNLHKKSFETVSSFLQQYDFTPAITLEDVSMAQGTIQYIAANWEQTIYCTVFLNKASGKIHYVSFSAFVPQNTFISVDNTYALPIRHPENLLITHLPNASLETIYQELLHTLAQQPASPAPLSTADLLSKGYELRQNIIELGIQQQLLYIKGTEHYAPATSMCYYHPTSIAVRRCGTCGTAVCEACYIEYQEQYYCPKCLPGEIKRRIPQPVLPEGNGYAGFGVRTVATLLDAVLLSAFLATMYFGLFYGLRGLLPDANMFIPFLITQCLAVLTITTYFIVPVKKYGRTLGQKFLGLRIVDIYNRSPETVAVIVRFAYFLLSCLFVFPLLGYLFILFKKNKQGLHDRLAGTFVITKRPGIKAVFSWGILLLLCGVMSWYAYQYRAVLSLFSFFSAPPSYAPEITLKSKWVKDFIQEERAIISYVNRGEHCLVSTSNSLYALQMQTGEIVWSLDDMPNVSFQSLSKDLTLPLLAVQHQTEGNDILFHIAPNSGEIIWQQPLEIEYPRITFDAQTIIAYDYSNVYAYETQHGQPLWNRYFQDQLSLDYIRLHTGILLGRYSETSLTLLYLDRATGQTRWKKEDSPYSPGYLLSSELQIFYTENGKAMLMDLSQQQPLWEAPRDIGHVIAHADDPLSGETYIYTTEAAVKKDDGALIFSYPPLSRFGPETDDFLIILQEDEMQKSTLILIDKFTGVIKQYIENRAWFALIYLNEDQSTIYLAATLKPESPNSVKIRTQLVRIDKQTLEVTETPIGQNIGAMQFKIFSQDHLVFIPSYQRLGGYILPET